MTLQNTTKEQIKQLFDLARLLYANSRQGMVSDEALQQLKVVQDKCKDIESLLISEEEAE